MEGRGWRFGLAGVALLLHMLVLAALPPLNDRGARAEPVMVRLEAPEPAQPVAPAPPPVAAPPTPPAPPAAAAKRQPVSVPRTPAHPPPPQARPQPALVKTTAPPATPPAGPAGAVAAAPPAAPSEPVHLAGLGQTGAGPAVEGAGHPGQGNGPGTAAPAGDSPGEGAAPAVSAEDLRQLLAQYGGSVSGRIRAHQVYPDAEQQAGHEGKVKLSFTLGADGKLLGVDVEGSSGFGGLDSAAVAAVKSAAPFEPIPSALHRNNAKLSITLRFYLK